MKKIIKHKKGQFVIIAMLMIATMIISIGALLYTAVTYYKHEPWEEYLTLIGNIELSCHRLVELSLANYTNTQNHEALRDNLQKWQRNLTTIYPGYGITLDYTLVNDGLTLDWNKSASFSAANAAFTLDIASIGLTGYKFVATPLLSLRILSPPADNTIDVTVTGEDEKPITNLKTENFQVNGLSPSSVVSRFGNETYPIIYTLQCNETITGPVKVWDQRGIQVSSKYP